MAEDGLEEHLDRHGDDYLTDLESLLRQPSISATGEGMDACLDGCRELLDRYGFDIHTIETVAHPLIVAEWSVDDALPTVCFYGHYDVQPPGDRSAWTDPPFEPTVRDGAIYARGSADNKGQFLAHCFAVDLLRRRSEPLPANVMLLLEGDEETGSAGLADHLAADPDTMADIDLVVIADGPMPEPNRPALAYGNRGVLAVEIEVETGPSDRHSGHFGGGVPDAGWTLIRLLASMRGDDWDGGPVTGAGSAVAVDGFHEAVAIPPSAHAMLESVPESSATGPDGYDEGVGSADAAFRRATALEPTGTINGIKTGYLGEGMKTIVPHRAVAKLDFRLVPQQEPSGVLAALRRHVAERVPEATVTRLGSFPPWMTSLDTPFADPVREALTTVWGSAPIERPMVGGSLPTAHLARAAGAPALLTPYGNPDQANHAPDEHLDLTYFENGILTSVRLLETVGPHVDAPGGDATDR